ncbi:MAG: DUF4160 domain-containing protein [Methyloprofundus sp.]
MRHKNRANAIPFFSFLFFSASSIGCYVKLTKLLNRCIHNTVFKGGFMPTISMFYGIVVSIFYGETKLHNRPHIHARYQWFKVSICIDTGEVLAGELPIKN